MLTIILPWVVAAILCIMASRKEIDGKTTQAAKQTATSSFINTLQTGLQAEFEERMEAHTLNGVESGCAISISTTTIVIASGVAWCEGKRYEPANSTISFSASDSAVLHYLYIDPTNDTTPYQKATADPGAGYLLLGEVTWNGSDTLSGLVDYKRMGLVYHEFQLNIPGSLSDGDDAFGVYGGSDGRSFWLEGVKGIMENCGTGNGPTYHSVYKVSGSDGSEAAVWNAAGQRLFFAHDDTDKATKSGAEPVQNRTFAAGDSVRARVDNAANGAVAAGAADAWLVAYGRLV
jgi:hypothetical protein